MDKIILMIDDDPVALYINEEVIQIFLKSPLSTYLNAEDALAFLSEKFHDEFNALIFLDLNMPDLDGWQFLEAITTYGLSSRISVVIITSSIDRRDYIKAFKYPCVRKFINKPLREVDISALTSDQLISEFFMPEDKVG